MQMSESIKRGIRSENETTVNLKQKQNKKTTTRVSIVILAIDLPFEQTGA